MEIIDGVLHIGGLAVPEIASRFGTPFYLYDAATIERQMQRLERAFASLPFRPFYAMKANGNLEILRRMQRRGFGCDAVSPGEIHIARAAGFGPDDIWFTCSNVSDDDLRAIHDPRIVINVNSMSEIDRCLALDLENPIALRMNPDVGAGHHHDVVTAGGGVKFGIDLAEIESARMVIEDAGRKVVGIHAHIGSGIDTIAPLLASARRLVETAASFPNLRFVNFGGGIGIPYRPGDAEFPLDDYGIALGEVADGFLRSRNAKAILEPGRFLVAQSGFLVARVTAKRVSAGQTWIGCDTGFNHLARPSKYSAYHHIVNGTAGSPAALPSRFDGAALPEELVVAGNLCESGDVFTRGAGGLPEPRRMDRTKVGDLIAFCDAGAYGFSMASHYNARLMPPEILVENGSASVIRARQDLDSLLAGMV